MRAAELNTENERVMVAFSDCHQNRKCANLHITTPNSSNVPVARAARLIFLIRPIKFLICDFVVDAKVSC